MHHIQNNNDTNENKCNDNENEQKFVNHKISDVDIGAIPNGKSVFVTPKRMKFKQNGRDRKWDLVESMGAVAALCYHSEKKSFLFVKQFRPPVYYQRMKDGTINDNNNNNDNDNNNDNKGHQVGCTVECIAGLLDKPNKSPLETVQEELIEEVGYKVPSENIEFIANYRSAVGILGTKTTIYFAKIEESMKCGDGGGSIEENECIELIWIPVKTSRKFVLENDDIPPGLKFAVFWFYYQHPELCKDLE